MAKYACDEFLDAFLDYIEDSDRLCICSAQPTTYAEATSTYMLAIHTLTSGDFTQGDDASGRKLTILAQTGITVTNPGDATHVALAKSGDSSLKAVTTCDTETLTAAQVIATPDFDINIQDPT